MFEAPGIFFALRHGEFLHLQGVRDSSWDVFAVTIVLSRSSFCCLVVDEVHISIRSLLLLVAKRVERPTSPYDSVRCGKRDKLFAFAS